MDKVTSQCERCDKAFEQYAWRSVHPRYRQRYCSRKCGVRQHGTFEQRFWGKVNKAGANGCWLWTGVVSEWGHGRLREGGKKGGRMTYAHRISWELHKGAVPEGLRVLHRCDVPNCVNPEHLFLGTDQDNRDDMIRKGRGAWQTRDWGKFLKRVRRKKAA